MYSSPLEPHDMLNSQNLAISLYYVRSKTSPEISERETFKKLYEKNVSGDVG